MIRILHILIIISILLLSTFAKGERFNTKTYDDCVLENIGKANTAEALKAIKQACKNIHPQTFDFMQIAKKAGVKSWEEVLNNEDYIKLSDAEKKEAKAEYFEEVILPNIHQDFKEEALFQFKRFANKIEKSVD
jgi:plasmid replication initiation protein